MRRPFIGLCLIAMLCGTMAIGQDKKKFAGELFGPRRLPVFDVPVPDATLPNNLSVGPDRPTRSTKSALPPLAVKIYVSPQAELPASLRGHVNERSLASAASTAGLRRFRMDSPTDEVIVAAITSPEVQRVEIDRPRGYLPSPGILPANLPSPGGQIQVFNRDARISHLVPDFLATFATQSDKGAGILLAVFDEGAIRRTHVEFVDSRVTLHTQQPLSRHSTHVGGTIGAKGAKPLAIGMAEQVKIVSFDWLNDLNELDAAAGGASPIRVSNHSYGPLAGWTFDFNLQTWFWWGDTTISQDEDSKFGKYTGDNQTLDDLLSRAPHLLTVVAAGNDRRDGPAAQPVQHYAIGRNPATGDLQWNLSTRQRKTDGFDHGGLDTVAGLGLSKNALCIGAIRDVVNAGDLIAITEFSGWGPADDGRVKPDLVANGEVLLSTSNADDEAYVEMSGTSMASPTAAGIACLLVEQHKKVKGNFPNSDMTKAIMIHSATDAGTPGPDPVFGFGSINTLAAGRIIAGQHSAWTRADTVSPGSDKVFEFDQAADGPRVRATLVWIDPAAPANTGGLDDASLSLQNDLDLTLTAPDNSTFFPYSLDRANPLSPATRSGANKVDNVEVIDAPPQQGRWSLRVKAANLKVGTEQRFAIVVTGLAAH